MGVVDDEGPSGTGAGRPRLAIRRSDSHGDGDPGEGVVVLDGGRSSPKDGSPLRSRG